MDTYRRLERHAEIVARHVDSPSKRRLVSEFLEDLPHKLTLASGEKARLTITLLRASG
jgi:hypothetical protein